MVAATTTSETLRIRPLCHARDNETWKQYAAFSNQTHTYYRTSVLDWRRVSSFHMERFHRVGVSASVEPDDAYRRSSGTSPRVTPRRLSLVCCDMRQPEETVWRAGFSASMRST